TRCAWPRTSPSLTASAGVASTSPSPTATSPASSPCSGASSPTVRRWPKSSSPPFARRGRANRSPSAAAPRRRRPRRTSPAGRPPTPHQPGGPSISLGGSSQPAARRAARLGCRFSPSSAPVWDFYRNEVLALGQPDPGPHPGGDTSFFHLATDVDKGWDAVAPYALHEATSYGKWMDDAGVGSIGGWDAPPADADALPATRQA